MDKEYHIKIECMDLADAIALRKRVEDFLLTLDNGDYKGRIVEVE